MKLTVIIPSLGPGGAERVVSILAGAWAAKDWVVTILTFDDGTTPSFHTLPPSVTHRPLGLTGSSGGRWLVGLKNNVIRLQKLRRAIREANGDAVLSFIDHANVLVLLAGIGLRKPIVVSERTDPASLCSGRLWNRLARLTYPLADAVVAQTPEAVTYWQQHCRCSVLRIANPVLPPPAAKDAVVAPRPQIVAMGRFTAEKRFDMLLRAFATAVQDRPTWRLTLFGDGPLRAELESLRTALGLDGRAHMPGVVSDVPAAMRSGEIFVLSSRFEGFPNVLCEAMACGLAVIATDCPNGPRAIVRPEVDGVLVPNEDQDALATTMARMMDDQALRLRLGRAAPEILDRFALPRILAQWEAVLMETRR